VKWSYQGYPERHIGAMAQDFHALFPLNPDDKSLNDADLHGVTLAAIQGLNQKLDERDAEIQTLRQQNETLEKRLERLEQTMKSIAER
jgi:small-conductance mechanosensitive channel